MQGSSEASGPSPFQSRDSLVGYLFRASATSMAVRVSGLALAFAAHLVLSRVLGANQYGHYVIALGWAMVLVIPARLGLDNSVLRYATIYREEGRFSDLRGLVRFSLGIISLLSLSIAGALLLGKAIGLEPLRPVSTLLLLGVAMLIPFSAVIGWLSSLIRTANRIFAAQFYDQMLRPILLILAVGAWAWSGRLFEADQAMLLTGATVGAAVVGLAIHTRAIFAGISSANASFEHRREWLSVSWALFLMAVVQEVLNQVDIILLGIVSNATEAAHFAAAWRLASLVPFGLVAIATISGPLIASAYSRNDLHEMARIARLSSRFSTLSGLVLAMALGVLGTTALGLFGSGFETAYSTLLILLAGGLVNSFTGTVGYFLALTGHHRVALIILLAALVFSITLNLLLIPPFGANGSAIASASALCFWNVAMAIYVRLRIGVDATAMGRPPLVLQTKLPNGT